MPKDKVEVKEIVLKLGKKEITLTVDECKKLNLLLQDLFGKEVIVQEFHNYHPHTWYYSPSLPVFTNPFYCGDTYTTCTANGSSVCLTVGDAE